MGKRGPRPEPTALKLVKGARADRINDAEPVPRQARPEPPPELTPPVLEVWHYTVGELDHMRILTAADRDALVCYCEAVVRHREASRLIAAAGILVEGRHGIVKNPAVQIQRDAAQLIRAFAQEFGLTPSARSEVRTDAHGHGEAARSPQRLLSS